MDDNNSIPIYDDEFLSNSSLSSDNSDFESDYSDFEEPVVVKKDFINKLFANCKDSIKLYNVTYNGIKEILNNHNKYNLVIFDMNLVNGFGFLDDEQMKAELYKYNINADGIEKDSKIAGLYLYQLLLAKAYPMERMVIFSGNADSVEKLNDGLKSEVFRFSRRSITPKPGPEDKKLDVENVFYSNDNDGYYKVRRLVLQACDYWKNELKKMKDSDSIAFNTLYKCKKSSDNFIEILEHVEMLFSVIKPENPQNVYYQAAQVICSLHESSAEFKNIIGKDCHNYHSVVRCFRNWSSHDKFKKREMNDKTFALLFCIALRTYFDSDDCLYYEKCFFFEQSSKPDDEKDAQTTFVDLEVFANNFKTALEYIISPLNPKNLFPYYKESNYTFTELVLSYGNNADSNSQRISTVFYPLLFGDITIIVNPNLILNDKDTYNNLYINTRIKIDKNAISLFYKQTYSCDSKNIPLFLKEAYSVVADELKI